jgi:tetratricopeptide (TPR) repeat protein
MKRQRNIFSTLPEDARMRNRNVKSTAIGLFLAIALIGCGPGPTTPQENNELTAGYRALDQHQSEQAIQRADDYLRQQPDGPGDAEAMYLKGRGYEQKTAASPAEAARNLAAARAAYDDALNLNPSPKTQGYICASLSNVAFFQEDYLTALSQASQALILVKSPAIQADLLYRIGVSQQRLGRFTDADRTFDQVQTDYPGSPIAQSAHQHEGMRDFYVELGTFDSVGADHVIASLQNSQLPISRQTVDPSQTIVRAGPFPDYESAKSAKTKLVAQYPQSQIVP